jgi:hypothetical protein
MPYIDRDKRDDVISAENPGELNYLITLLVADYIKRKGKNYATLNEVVGVLECAKLELYRRVAAPYEDQKCEDNGDVY